MCHCQAEMKAFRIPEKCTKCSKIYDQFPCLVLQRTPTVLTPQTSQSLSVTLKMKSFQKFSPPSLPGEPGGMVHFDASP